MGPSNPPPTSPPNPPNSSFPSIYWFIAAALITALTGALLAFLLFTRKRRVPCSKCHARVDPKLEKCPYCGNLLGHPNRPAEHSSPQATQQPTLTPSSDGSKVSTSSTLSAPSPPSQEGTEKLLTTNEKALSGKENPNP
jgi:hypothetical protein